jgi:hypothetical protein
MYVTIEQMGNHLFSLFGSNLAVDVLIIHLYLANVLKHLKNIIFPEFMTKYFH